MIERQLSGLILEAARRAGPELGLQEAPATAELMRPRQREHGDFATNVALALAGPLGKNPREVAEVLVRHFPDSVVVAKLEVAGPGFINIFLAHAWLYGVLGEVEQLGERYGHSDEGAGERVLVEFISANPTGPLHVGSGRNAVIGDSLARVLGASGFHVEREYYINDAGRQADLFAASMEARYLQHFGRQGAVPEEGYGGVALVDLAARIAADLGDSLLDLPSEDRRRRLGEEGIRRVLEDVGRTLARMDVRIDHWVYESRFHAEGRIAEAVERLRELDLAYDRDGAVWFRAERYGDEKDRVLVRSNGEPTYFAADCAYLLDKFGRGFERLIYVWGADHHGAVNRLQGAAQAFGFDVERAEFILYQLVNLRRGAEPVRMSKRTGETITLDEVLDEVGADAARYTLLSRSSDTTIDFDIELVKSQSLENPVYYVQYAHARIASVLRFAEERGAAIRSFAGVDAHELVHETELDLLRKIVELPEQVHLAATMRAPYRLSRYAEELAAGFHRFYTECRVVTDDAELTQARLHLSRATKQAIGNVLSLLGVTAPESMERLEEGTA
jgi:arginyl-tRNA synthetase